MKIIMPMACVHVGAESHDRERLLRDLADARRLGAIIYLVGDAIDNQVYAGTKHTGTVYEAKLNPDEQIDEVISLFRRHHVGGVLGGNHPERTKKAAGIHPEKVIADRLSVAFHPEVLATRIEGHSFVFTHGVGSNDNDFKKVLLAYDGVDCICIGHNHELSYRPVRRVETLPGRRKTKVVHQVRCGSYLDYAAYARRALYAPTPTGCPRITVMPHDIKVDIHA